MTNRAQSVKSRAQCSTDLARPKVTSFWYALGRATNGQVPMKASRALLCPECGSKDVRHLGRDANTDEDLYECRACGCIADVRDF